MKFSYRKYLKTVALIWGTSLGLSVLIYILVLAPQVAKKKHLEQQFAQKKQLYDSALQAARQSTKTLLKNDVDNLNKKLKDFVIDFEDSANLTFDISQIANQKNISSLVIEGKQDTANTELPNCDSILENQINISFTAGFNQFAVLLNALERHKPVIFVDGFSITRSDQGTNNHPVNMILSVFVRKPQNS